jgi:tyrosine-protein kinase
MSKRENVFDTRYILYLLKRYWLLISSILLLGATVAFCFNEFSTPMYKSHISLFTWNRSITDAIKKVKKSQKDKETNKVEEVMMHNSIISQSIYLGQRLIFDYINIINNPQVKRATDAALIKKGFKAPLKYSFECTVKRKSCIMNIAVVSPDRKLAAEAANSLVKSFEKEQESLMDIKYAKAMHEATVAVSPFLPRKRLNLSIGIVLGILLGLAIACILDYMDMTIKNPDDLKKINLLPLGVISYYTDIDNLYIPGKTEIDRHGNSILDGIRIINTTISFLKVDDPPKAIEFTSALPSAGKSTLALLLAKIMGQEHKKILLLDCDLRKPRIDKNLKLPHETGLVNYLTDKNCDNPKKYIHSNIFPNVDLMTHGVIPPNPTELLGSKRFADMIEKLKTKYDCILLDSSPCSGMADAMVLGKSVDAIVMVVDSEKTRIHDVTRNLEQFDTLRDKIIGAVLNKVNFKKNSDYYYSYGYYYHDENSDIEDPTPQKDQEE